MFELRLSVTRGMALLFVGCSMFHPAAFGIQRRTKTQTQKAASFRGIRTLSHAQQPGPDMQPVRGSSFARETSLVHRQAMENFHDLQYFGKLTIGKQELNVVLDTGSIEFVVLSDKCVCWCGQASRLFHSNRSESYHHGALSLILSYGSGDLLGQEAYDTVSFGPFVSAGAPFWEVSDASMPLLLQSDWSAIIGLGPTAASTKILQLGGGASNKESFAVLPKKLGISKFSICLGKEPGSNGYITWNDNVAENNPSDFTKVRIADVGYWMVRMTDVWLGDSYIACADGCGAIPDSGTSLISLPASAFEEMKKAIEALHTDCKDMAGLPDLHFKLDGMPHSLPPDAYIGNIYGQFNEHLGGSSELFTVRGGHNQDDSAESSCAAALMHISMDSSFGPMWILGMPFFRRYYSVFNQRTVDEPPALYTALATEDCYATGNQDQFLLGSRARSNYVVREVNISRVHIPAWVQRAARLGYLEEKPDQTGRGSQARPDLFDAASDMGGKWSRKPRDMGAAFEATPF